MKDESAISTKMNEKDDDKEEEKKDESVMRKLRDEGAKKSKDWKLSSWKLIVLSGKLKKEKLYGLELIKVCKNTPIWEKEFEISIDDAQSQHTHEDEERV
ncbi:hypothetical protein Tco_0562241 [Tanacetum coccineum]